MWISRENYSIQYMTCTKMWTHNTIRKLRILCSYWECCVLIYVSVFSAGVFKHPMEWKGGLGKG